MDEFKSIFCDIRTGEVSYCPTVPYSYEKRKITPEHLNKVKEYLKSHSINEVFDTNCGAPGCGCVTQISYFERMEMSTINLELLQWLISNGYLPIKSDANLRKKALNALDKLFTWSGGANYQNQLERSREQTEYILSWLCTEIPEDLCTYMDEYGSTFLHYIFYGYDDSMKEKYMTCLLDLYEKVGRTIPEKPNRGKDDAKDLRELIVDYEFASRVQPRLETLYAH